jgi:hypothetical protein
MDPAQRFHRDLARRLMTIAAGAALTVPVAGAGCGGSVVDPTGGGAQGAGGGGNPSGTGGTSTTGSESTTGSLSSSSSTSTTTTSNTSTTSTGTTCGDGVECFDWPPQIPCPGNQEALQYMEPCNESLCMVTSIDGAGNWENGQCCYPVTTSFCGVGRPYLVDGRARVARLSSQAGDWSRAGSSPEVGGLRADVRAALADAWASDALLEHASVAAFARFSLELLAWGAPSDLVTDAHLAALDEVRHAGHCFRLASAYRGAPVEPARFPLEGSVPIAANLPALAVATFHEGCVGETIAALVASEQRARASDPAVQAVLDGIAADEARHAELAWRTVAWAIRAGGADVVEALRGALERIHECAPRPEDDARLGGETGHGRLDAAAVRAVFVRGLQDLVLPCARALLANHESRSAAELEDRV